MKPILFYIAQVVVASGLLYGYYHFAFRNKKFHRYNRFYLLMAVIISSFIPFLNIPVYFSEEARTSSAVFQTLQVISSPSIEIEKPVTQIDQIPTQAFTRMSTNTILYIIYFAIASIFILRILFSFNKIRRIIKKYPVEQFDKVRFVNTDEPNTPFSFFRWLFWNRKIDLHSDKGEQIFRHELFHIQQKHSWDVVFLEIISTIFWLNPFFHLIKKEVKAIHEFLADEFAIKEDRNWQYAELLLMQALNTNNRLVNAFFHNQIKRRIAMITLSKKPTYQYLRKIMVLPLTVFIVSLFAFSYKKEPTKLTGKIDNAVLNHLTDTTKHLENALVVINGVIQQKRGIQNIDTSQFGSKVFNGSLNVYQGKDAVDRYGEKGRQGVIELLFDGKAMLKADTSPKVETVRWIKTGAFKGSPTSSDFKVWSDAKMFEIYLNHEKIDNAGLLNINPDDITLYSVGIPSQEGVIYSPGDTPSPEALNYNENMYWVVLFTKEYYPPSIAPKNSLNERVKNHIPVDTIKQPEPLFVINDKPIPGLSLSDIDKILSAQDIESITVLKGQSAIDKYGDKGKNGAIEIKAKKLNPVTQKGETNDSSFVVKPQQTDDNKIFVKVEIEPSFKGGYQEWKNYLARNLNKDLPKKNGAPGGAYTVVVQFIVDKDGRLSNVKTLTAHGYGMEEEAMRVIKKGPDWLPGIQNGRAVKAYRKQPITFVVTK